MDGSVAEVRKRAPIQAASVHEAPVHVVMAFLGQRLPLLLGAALLSWPAIYNGFPLLYPDSMTYLERGRALAQAVFLHRFAGYYGFRSLLYTLTIFPLHWNVTAWPIVALQCLVAAWVVRLLARVVWPGGGARAYLALMVFLSLLTSLSWYADFIMPDVLGPLAYLALILLACWREGLSRWERVGLGLAAWWGITAHSTHLLLAVGLVALLGLMAACEPKWFLDRMRGVALAVAVVVFAACSQVALNAYLYGKPSLTGRRPPYLTARILADGPGRWYLERNCGQEHWTICGRVAGVDSNPDSFLWGADAPYESSSDQDQERMEQEEGRFVAATLRAYPEQELKRAVGNFRQQLQAFGPYGFDSNEWTLEQFEKTLTPARASYMRSKEAHDALPLDPLATIQFWTVMASLAAAGVLILLGWRRRERPIGSRLSASRRMVELGICVLALVVVNALITGVLSTVDDRYGCRVIWMIPLYAGLQALDNLRGRQEALTASSGLTRSRSSLEGLK